ncbi:MAG: Ribosomal RNA small subunit methyltransferase I [Candidatus Anoxychlamydiales bacterium]|nr:Ribosomal RNA small subunit methyltransferase I [Candidatus Anoxychlamydiales bacterium]
MLYIISTPIGNLKDITLRALEILKLCDYILCEDTRVSKILLNKYEINKKLISFHKFSEKEKKQRVIENLEENKDIALISDAGTPLISDPGSDLIKTLIEKDLPYTAIPGPCSVIDALVMSGFDSTNFQFLGFIPKKDSEKKSFIKKTLFYPGTSIFFDSAKRAFNTLKIISSLDPNRKICILKELTKKFEKRFSDIAINLKNIFEKKIVKGEIVFLIEKGEIIDNIEIDELIKLITQNFSLSTKEAIKIAAKIKNRPKKEIYKKVKT